MTDWKAELIALIDAKREFGTDVDGYVYWWPTQNGGYFASHQLRALADELDRRNKDWDEIVRREMEGKPCQP